MTSTAQNRAFAPLSAATRHSAQSPKKRPCQTKPPICMKTKRCLPKTKPFQSHSKPP